MPKSAKKKKDKVADFSKAKLKLGKGKATPTNAIDTSFKARSIALPSQSIAAEKDTSQPITRRQLTFDDLISHFKHYSPGTRKDALIGLRELFDNNWAFLDSCLTPLVNGLVRLIGDEDASVRKQLLAFLAWLLPKVPQEDIAPHSPSLLLFTTSAQTHIFPETRIDAVRVLDVLLECIPESVVSGWCATNEGHGSRVLSGYLGILNAGTKFGENDGPLKATSTASVVLTPASRLVVLKSLSTFLRAALFPEESRLTSNNQSSSNTPVDAIFMRNAFPTLEAYYSFDNLLKSTPNASNRSVFRNWQPEVSPDDETADIFIQSFKLLENNGTRPWTLDDLMPTNDASVAQSSGVPSKDFVAHLANALHSTIIEAYLDCAPSVFSLGSTPSEIEVQLVVTTVRIAQSLYQTILHSSENVNQEHISHLESIVNYMAPYFPASTSDNKLDQAYEEFNLIFCELTSLAVNASQIEPLEPNQKRKPRKGPSFSSGHKAKASLQTQRVTQYITHRLRGETASWSQISVPINPIAYRALLPTIWALIGSAGTSADESNEVIHATLDHALKVSSKSSCKRLTVEFVGRLMLLGLEPHYHGPLSTDRSPSLKAKFDAWFMHLPQVLWELGNTNLPCTEIVLRVVLRILQRRRKTAQTEIIASLQSRLVPYFYMEHPSRGALPGPYRKLPPSSSSRIRFLVLDMVCIIMAQGRQGGDEFESLSKAVGLAVSGEDEQTYWTHIANFPSMNKK